MKPELRDKIAADVGVIGFLLLRQHEHVIQYSSDADEEEGQSGAEQGFASSIAAR